MAEFVTMTVGGVDVLVEAVRLPGSEPAPIGGDAGEKAMDAFEKANRVVASAATATWP
jgi:hypothetical protein